MTIDRFATTSRPSPHAFRPRRAVAIAAHPLRFATAVAIVGAALLAPPAHASDRPIATTVPAGDATTVRLVLPIGDIEVRGDGGDSVRADLAVRCRRHRDTCEDRASAVYLDSTHEGGSLTMTVRGYPRLFRSESMELRGVIHVPADLPLAVDMRIGALRVNDVHTDVRVDMGVGEVRMSLPAGRVHGVRLGSSLGDAHLDGPQGHIEARRSFLLGARLDWRDGAGNANVNVDLGVGEVSVDLD